MHAFLLAAALSGAAAGAPAAPEPCDLAAAGGEERPLPEASALVAEFVARQERVDALREEYTYRERELVLEVKRSRAGVAERVREDRLWQVFPSRALFLRRLLARDARPLDAEEEREEDERIAKLLREHEEDERRRERRARAGKPPRRDDGEVELGDLLRVMRAETVGREAVRGRSCLVVAFRGDESRRPRSRAEKLAQHLEGLLWVDEADLQVARAEATLARLRFGGGILANVRFARFAFEQERVADGLWLPSRAEVEFRGRALLVKGFDRRVVAEFSDYRRYGAEVAIELGGPAGAP